MEYKCPHCGKSSDISAEELVLHGGSVVCPQCLEVYVVDGYGEMSIDQASSARLRAVAAAETAYAYCFHCGKKIPVGINYCPWCGLSLAPAVAAQVLQHEVAEPATGDDLPGEAATSAEVSAQPTAAKHATSRDEVIDWRPLLPAYRYSIADEQARHQREKASPLFKAVACLVMLIEVAFVALVIYKGWRWM